MKTILPLTTTAIAMMHNYIIYCTYTTGSWLFVVKTPYTNVMVCTNDTNNAKSLPKTNGIEKNKQKRSSLFAMWNNVLRVGTCDGQWVDPPPLFC